MSVTAAGEAGNEVSSAARRGRTACVAPFFWVSKTFWFGELSGSHPWAFRFLGVNCLRYALRNMAPGGYMEDQFPQGTISLSVANVGGRVPAKRESTPGVVPGTTLGVPLRLPRRHPAIQLINISLEAPN